MIYDSYYYKHGCGPGPYERSEGWLGFFDAIAQKIHIGIHPQSVLDVGCAMGFLVEMLRKRAIDAYGIDVSEYALRQVHPDCAPYCTNASITTPLIRRYDLIIAIEVFEHLTPDSCFQAVANICNSTDDVLFSSTPFDFQEVTHCNVQPPDYWARLFAAHGFFRDLNFDASFLTDWAARFRKFPFDTCALVGNYERSLWRYIQENHGTQKSNLEQRNRLADYESKVSTLENTLKEQAAAWSRQQESDAAAAEQQRMELEGSAAEIRDLQSTIEAMRSDYSEIEKQLKFRIQVLAGQVHAFQGRVDYLSAENERLAVGQAAFKNRLKGAEEQLSSMHNRTGWAILERLGRLRLSVMPRGSRREREWSRILRFMRSLMEIGLARTVKNAWKAGVHRAKPKSAGNKVEYEQLSIEVPGIQVPPEPAKHLCTVDVVICVHNALQDVRLCLDSVIRHTSQPYKLILIDDGSDKETADFLRRFSASAGAELLRNETAKRYTTAANQGMKASTGDFLVLLNSDTIVAPLWLDCLIACAESDPSIGMSGPLSNTASWQSVPDVFENQEWAANSLPEGMTVDKMAGLVARFSGRTYPRVGFLNGFCLLIRRRLVQEIGWFDEAAFPEGYGEENDYCMRARRAGWNLAVADDAYVYHAQSRSYSNEARKSLAVKSDLVLVERYGSRAIIEGLACCQRGRALLDLRERNRQVIRRQHYLDECAAAYRSKRVLFLLPVGDSGGGGHVVLLLCATLRQMGLEAQIFNLNAYRQIFTAGYPDLQVPVVFGEIDELSSLGAGFDAVIATAYSSVPGLIPIKEKHPSVCLGYYVQDFEPYFFEPHTAEYKEALDYYTLDPRIRLFAHSAWAKNEVENKTGAKCALIRGCFDVDLFRARDGLFDIEEERRVCIVAMIRPETPRRGPRLTMEILKRIHNEFGSRVEIVLFGCSPESVGFKELPTDFSWRSAGKINRFQVARLLGQADVFVDFSTFQAFGLTAIEAMASGAAVIVPQNGGASCFAVHDRNALVADTSDPEDCYRLLRDLVWDNALRCRIAQRGMADSSSFYPEAAAADLLEMLLGGR